MNVRSKGHPQLVEDHVYRLVDNTRRSLRGCSMFLIVFFCGIPLLRLSNVFTPRTVSHDVLTPEILMILLAIFLWERSSRRVTISENAIELAGWFSKRNLRREEIRGYRMGYFGRAGGGSFYIIVPLE